MWPAGSCPVRYPSEQLSKLPGRCVSRPLGPAPAAVCCGMSSRVHKQPIWAASSCSALCYSHIGTALAGKCSHGVRAMRCRHVQTRGTGPYAMK